MVTVELESLQVALERRGSLLLLVENHAFLVPVICLLIALLAGGLWCDFMCLRRQLI